MAIFVPFLIKDLYSLSQLFNNSVDGLMKQYTMFTIHFHCFFCAMIISTSPHIAYEHINYE